MTELLSLWQTPQTKYKALWGLQEYVRLASSFTFCKESTDATKAESTREAAAVIIAALINKVDQLLAIAEPDLDGQWPRIRVVTGLPCPTLDQGNYFWGVLDCAAQLAELTDTIVDQSLINRMRRLVLKSNVPQYRWKAMEVLFSFKAARREHLHSLELGIEEISNRSVKDTLRQEVSTTWNLMISKQGADLRPGDIEPLASE